MSKRTDTEAKSVRDFDPDAVGEVIAGCYGTTMKLLDDWRAEEANWEHIQAALEQEDATMDPGDPDRTPEDQKNWEYDEHQRRLRIFLAELFKVGAALVQMAGHVAGKDNGTEPVTWHANMLVMAVGHACDVSHQMGAQERAIELLIALDTHGEALMPALVFKAAQVDAYDQFRKLGRQVRISKLGDL